MAAGLTFGGELLREGGWHRSTPTLHSMSSSIFLLGPSMLTQNTHKQDMHKLDVHRHNTKGRNGRIKREKAQTNKLAILQF